MYMIWKAISGGTIIISKKRKKKLEVELFDKDDRLLGEEYDKDLVEQLKSKIATLNEQSISLYQRPEVKVLRAQ